MSKLGQSFSLSREISLLTLKLNLNIKKYYLIYIFVFLALSVRIIFWLYTGRIWEDAMITSTAVENAINGFGLTHHTSEPRVQVITSPLAAIIPLSLQLFFEPILSMRLISLVAIIGTIIYGYKICCSLNFKIVATIFVLSFLSFNYLHIFFGMAGMETQVATFFLLATIFYSINFNNNKYYYLFFGVSLAFSMLSRPDFILPCCIICTWLIFNYPKNTIKAILFSLLIYLPWLIFSVYYYGSAIPHTISVKSGTSLYYIYGIKESLLYLIYSWAVHAPVYEYILSLRVSIFSTVSFMVLFMQFIIVLYSFFYYKKNKIMFLFLLIFIIFSFYRVSIIHNSYYMWYIPPFTGILSFIIAYGLDCLYIKRKSYGVILVSIFSLALLLPIPFMYNLDKQYQQYFRHDILAKIGIRLNALMSENDTVVLEPLGYIGYYARNKTIYDYPGLGSNIASEVLMKPHGSDFFSLLIKDLKPDYAVLRTQELDGLKDYKPVFYSDYRLVERFYIDDKLKSGPFFYMNFNDNAFFLFKRNASI
jgi:hypothetical protein